MTSKTRSLLDNPITRLIPAAVLGPARLATLTACRQTRGPSTAAGD